MQKTNKYEYLQVIQGNYGQGWEDIYASNKYTDIRANLRAYRKEEPHIPFRVINRRVATSGNT